MPYVTMQLESQSIWESLTGHIKTAENPVDLVIMIVANGHK